uniref:Integrase core domain containing protein n=1 Tax=Solanum tuberosum TaxID=4113 RepID=M1DC03_SOLTU
METGSKTYPPKGNVTLESSMRTPTEESRIMILDESLAEFRRHIFVMNSRLTKVEDEIWAKERGFTLPSPGEASPDHRCDHLPTGLARLHADVAALLAPIETEPESAPAVPEDEVVITTVFGNTMPPPDFSLTTRKCPRSDHTIDIEKARHLRKKE